jgi:hypothetical protein
MTTPSNPLFLRDGEKFSIIAFVRCVSTVTSRHDLAGGSIVLPGVGPLVDDWWKCQIGEIQYNQLQECDLALVRRQPSEHKDLLDHENATLYKELYTLFNLLHISGVPNYDKAFALNGSVTGGRLDVRQVGPCRRFRPTFGSPASPVTPERLQEAARVSEVWREMRDPDYARFKRGLFVLLDGLCQEFARDRLHQYVRALEALIVPEQGKTKKQFVHRCQTFGGNHQDVATLLSEAFDMRSDVQHLHAWDRSLAGCPIPDRQSLAMKRTRQMEGLACAAYRRILSETLVRHHFQSDEAIARFWALPDEKRRSNWGAPFDVLALQ